MPIQIQNITPTYLSAFMYNLLKNSLYRCRVARVRDTAPRHVPYGSRTRLQDGETAYRNRSGYRRRRSHKSTRNCRSLRNYRRVLLLSSCLLFELNGCLSRILVVICASRVPESVCRVYDVSLRKTRRGVRTNDDDGMYLRW